MTDHQNDQRVIVSLNDVAEMTSISRASVNRLRDAGKFPRPIQLGERKIGFVKTEVLAWIEARVNEREFA